jgi:hypothetical protein
VGKYTCNLCGQLNLLNDKVLVTDETAISAIDMLRSEGRRDGNFIPPKATMRIKEPLGGILKLQSSNKFHCIEVHFR